MMKLPTTLMLAVLVSSCSSLPPAHTAQDELQLRDLPVRFSEAWAAHDGAALARIMSPDVDFVNVGAIWTHGQDFAIYHARILAGRFAKSTNRPIDTDVQFVREDLGIVRWSWRIDGETDASGASIPTRYGLMTMLAEKRNGTWLVIDAQNTNAGPQRPEADGLVAPIMVPRNP